MSDNYKRKKICFVASSGGHWEEAMCLKEIADENDSFFVTEAGGQVEDIHLSKVYTLPQINRHERHFALHFSKLFLEAWKIIHKEKPEVVITTGALISFPFCLITKIHGKKVVYIESFARVHEKSLTGKLVYPFTDLFLVQWESMLECYPKAKYGGRIF
jgi:UDP-N-acetylglucosamine:LPS N-acetylglucosamine transferase